MKVPWRVLAMAAGAALAVASPVGAAPSSPGEALLAAHRLFNDGELDQAAKRYQSFVSAFPRHPKAPEAVFYLGEAHLRRRGLDLAEKAYREGVRRYPGSSYAASCRYRIGECLFLRARYAEAAVVLREFLRTADAKSPFREAAASRLGESCLRSGQVNRAAEAYQAALTRYPKSPSVRACRLQLAECRYRQKRYAEAARLYAELLDEAEGRLAPKALYGLANSLFATGGYDEAAMLYMDLLRQAPAASVAQEATLRLGQCQFAAKRYATAALTLEPLARSDSVQGGQAALWRARALCKDARPKEAVAALAEAIAQQPASPVAADLRFEQAKTLVATGRHAQAAPLLADFLVRHPGEARTSQVLYWLCESNAALGRHDVACRNARTALSAFPGSEHAGPTLALYARSLAAREDFTAAADAFDRLQTEHARLAHEPLNRHFAALSLYSLKRWKDALQALGPAGSDTAKPAGPRAETPYLRGASHYHLRQFDKAVAPLAAYVDTQADGRFAPEALAYLSVACARTERLSEANRHLNQLASRFPTHSLVPMAVYERGEAELAANRLAQAVGWFDAVIAQHAKSPYVTAAASGKAWALYRQGRFTAAAKAFAELAALKPEAERAEEAAYMQARSLEDAARFADAITVYRAFADRFPASERAFEARLRVGRCHASAKHVDQAVAVFRKLAATHPKSKRLPEIYYDWAWTLRDAGRRTESDAVFAELLRAAPDSVLAMEARLHLAGAAFRKNDLKEARRRLSTMRDANPPARLAEPMLYMLGRCAMAEGQWREAVEVLGELTRRFPKGRAVPEVLLRLSEAQVKLDDRAGAEKTLRQLASRPAVPKRLASQAWLRLAELLVGQEGKAQEARDLCLRIRDRHADFADMASVDLCLADANVRLDRLDDAIAVYRRLAKNPSAETAAKAQYKLGVTLAAKGDYYTAIRALSRVIVDSRLDTWRAAALFEAAACYEKLEQWAAAVAAYEELRRKFPDSPEGKQAVARLESARQHMKRLKRIGGG